LSGEPEQTPLAQSFDPAHSWPVPHFGHDEPQSASVSVPFFTPSEQVGVAQTPDVHTLLVQSPATEHFFPGAHFAAQLPPQSTSVSVPFCTRSAHVAAWHTPPVHTPLRQSEAAAHFLVAEHLAQTLPPQSTSVSLPFCTRSLHAAAWHFSGDPEHTLLWQSVPAVQVAPVPHLAQALVPPQSTSLSPSFFTTSEQLGTWQMLPRHTPLRQSPATEQTLPLVHLPQLPPQSTSVSVPFFTLSPQPAAWHLSGEPEQTPLVQSFDPAHSWPVAHFGHDEPQSTSVSVPFFTPSEQVGVAQVPDVHTLLVQSPATEHFLPGAHLVEQLPPQSTSVSVPFCT